MDSEEKYCSFAYVYDELMDKVPYEEWCGRIYNILKKYNICQGSLVADLACGTGIMTRMLKQKGYDMIGIDLSEDMLCVARESDCEGILYLQQDMREFELYGTVAAIVSACDSVNYMLEEKDLLQVLKLVNNYLDPEGIFVFDFNLPEKYAGIGDGTIAENRDNVSFIWENYYDNTTEINCYELTLFIKNNQNSYDKYYERHLQRGYSCEQMKKLIEKAGMDFLEYFHLPDNRILMVAKERGKKNEGCNN